MRKHSVRLVAAGVVFVAAMTGCTIHPAGEKAERSAMKAEGTPYRRAPEMRRLAPLPADAGVEQIVRYALLANADLEQKYWDWVSAVEQVPQDGTQPTTAALFGGTTITNGNLASATSTIGGETDPMSDFIFPPKYAMAARRSLENARAAGIRFKKTKYQLRAKVLTAYFAYASTAEMIRLEESNLELLRLTAQSTESRSRTGAAPQGDLLKARNDIDLSQNQIENDKAQLPGQLAALNALLNRDPGEPIALPAAPPAAAPLPYADSELIALAARQNPELQALAAEAAAKTDALKLAKLQYYPDFGFSANSDLAGVAQNLAGYVTLPALRYQAIDAAIRQAEANIKSKQAERRQATRDVTTQLVTDLATLHDADRQLDLIEHTLLPRARQVVTVGRSSYSTGRTTLLDLLDSQRSLIAIRRMASDLRVERAQRLADVESLVAVNLGTQHER